MHKPQKKHNEIRGYVKRVFLCPSRHAALSPQKKQGLKKPLLLCFYNIAFFIVVNREKCRTSIPDLPLRTWLLWKRKNPDHADRSNPSSLKNCFYPTYAFA